MQGAAAKGIGRFPQAVLVLTALLAAVPPVHAAALYDPVAFWEFSSDFSDLTGNYNGNGVNSPQVVVAPDGFGNALHLEGPTAEQYIDFGTANPMALSGPMTISAWIRPDTYSTADNGGAVILGDEDNQDWVRVTGDDRVSFKVDNATTTINFSSTFTTNEWQHVVLTRDAANNVTIYRNTDQVATGTRANTFYPEYIGLKAPNATTNYYKGYMADVGVWDSVLTSGQIDELYMRGTDPVRGALAFWTFDSDFSNSGTSGTTHDGYPLTESTPFTVTNAMGDRVVGDGALRLRGSTAKDYVQIGDNGSGDPVGLGLDGSMTIAAWLNPEVLGSSGGTFLGGTNDDWIRLETGGKITVRFGGSGNNWNTTLSEGFETDEWQHFMLTRDTDGNLEIYRNLQLVASRSDYDYTFSPLYLGLKYPGGSSVNYYRGLMDDFGVWDRVLSPLEMQALYLRIPEPGSMVLLLCGAMVSLLWRRRRVRS